MMNLRLDFRNRWVLLGPLMLLMVGLSGCIYEDLEVLSIEDFSDVKLGLDGMHANMEVDVFNPNPYAVTVIDADVELLVNGEVVGDVEVLESQVIRPKARATVALEVRTREGAFGRVLKNDLMNVLLGNQVTFLANGAVKGKAFGLKFSIPIHHEESMNLKP